MSDANAVAMTSAHTPKGPLLPMPIDPALITAGNPVARGAVLNQSADRTLSSGLWTCEPGQFDWTYTWDEFCHVFEGEVAIAEEGGRTYTVGPGDMAYFPAGLKTHWHVKRAVRKYFVLRTAQPLNL